MLTNLLFYILFQVAMGKANQSAINELYEIRGILYNYRIKVIGFAFDGEAPLKY